LRRRYRDAPRTHRACRSQTVICERVADAAKVDAVARGRRVELCDEAAGDADAVGGKAQAQLAAERHKRGRQRIATQLREGHKDTAAARHRLGLQHVDDVVVALRVVLHIQGDEPQSNTVASARNQPPAAVEGVGVRSAADQGITSAVEAADDDRAIITYCRIARACRHGQSAAEGL
jgi:hypothetical protein